MSDEKPTSPAPAATETNPAAPAKASPAPTAKAVVVDRVAAFLAKRDEASDAAADEEQPKDEPAEAKAGAEGDKPDEADPAKAETEKADEDEAEKIPDMAAQRRSFAALSRREKDLRRAEAKLGDTRTKAQAFDQMQARFHREPVSVIAELMGMRDQPQVAVSKFLDAYIANGATGPTEPTDGDRLAAVEKQLADERAARANEHVTQVIDGNKRQVRAAIEKEGERFDLINAGEEWDGVWDQMVAYYAKHKDEIEARGIALDPLAFAERYEKALEEAEDRRLSRSKKFGRRTPTDKQGANAGIPKVAAPAATAKTLTNNHVSTGPTPKNGVPRETLEQRMTRVKREMGITQ